MNPARCTSQYKHYTYNICAEFGYKISGHLTHTSCIVNYEISFGRPYFRMNDKAPTNNTMIPSVIVDTMVLKVQIFIVERKNWEILYIISTFFFTIFGSF